MNRKAFTFQQIAEAYERADGKCEGCGKSLAWNGFNAHHKKPRSILTREEIDRLGPGGGVGNIATLCPVCHRDVHDGRLEGFILRRWEEIPK